MKKSSIINFSITGALLALFVLFTILVKCVDVAAVGPLFSKVGLSHLNINIFNALGTNEFLDKITDIFLILSAVVAFTIFCFGVIQFVKRKSLMKVDKEILFMAGLYILIALFFILFEVLEINFRPILVEGQLEASYPSSHTLIICSVMISSIFVFINLIKNKIIKYCYIGGASLIATLAALFRLLSGMHWFTDIVGSLFLAAFLIMLYVSIINLSKRAQK